MFRAIISTAIIIAAIMTSATSSVAAAHNTRSVTTTAACPFCSAIALTFSEQLNSNDIAVVAKLIEIPPPSNGPNADFPKAKFEILKILKGEKFVTEEMTFKTQLVGNYPEGQKFLVLGVDPPKVAWTTPMKASDRVFNYLAEIQELPESGPERLIYFQKFFEDKESVLAFDAYDEFARAPYEDLIAMKDQMDREKLLGWIKDTETSVTRKRLYFTMLGVCGKPEDTQLLEELITSDSRKKRAGLDALIACYLNLKGADGVDLIEKTFLADHEVDYVDTLAAVSALRFHGTELELIPKPRIVAAVRHLLDRPKMADMIIPDLARWEDWSVMERLVTMFKEADADSNWLRVPVITYLRACPKPEAKKYIEELRKIDPESVQRADFFLGVGDGDDEWDDADETEEESDKQNASDEKDKSEADADDDGAPVASVTHVVNKVALLSNNQEGTFATQPNALAPENEPAKTETVAVSTASRRSPNPNPSGSRFVTSTADSMASQTTPASVAPTVVVPAPVATTTTNLTWPIILIPMAVSVAIFLLLWSVVNGWFERLIF